MTLYSNNNKNPDNDFEYAYNLCEKEYTHAQLLEMLINGNVAQKQIAALKFDYVNDINDVMALLNNLTGCDGKIREAVAFKICSLINTDSVQELFAPVAAKIFADASIDINANICKFIIDSSKFLKKYKSFSNFYSKYITEYIYEALSALDKFIYKDKKYLINKQLFKLYWCLEALKYFFEFVDYDKLQYIIEKCSKISEYTIREQVAHILLHSNNFNDVKEKLLLDDNYYVKYLLQH